MMAGAGALEGKYPQGVGKHVGYKQIAGRHGRT